jgi:hypothetical protein
MIVSPDTGRQLRRIPTFMGETVVAMKNGFKCLDLTHIKNLIPGPLTLIVAAVNLIAPRHNTSFSGLAQSDVGAAGNVSCKHSLAII